MNRGGSAGAGGGRRDFRDNYNRRDEPRDFRYRESSERDYPPRDSYERRPSDRPSYNESGMSLEFHITLQIHI